MTKKEKEQVIDIIKKHFHIAYMDNGCPKMILTTHNLENVEKELDDLVEKKK